MPRAVTARWASQAREAAAGGAADHDHLSSQALTDLVGFNHIIEPVIHTGMGQCPTGAAMCGKACIKQIGTQGFCHKVA